MIAVRTASGNVLSVDEGKWSSSDSLLAKTLNETLTPKLCESLGASMYAVSQEHRMARVLIDSVGGEFLLIER